MGRSSTLVSLTLVECSDQVIHGELLSRNGEISLNVAIVYGQNSSAARSLLWGSLVQIANSTNGPWVVPGDFNNVFTLRID